MTDYVELKARAEASKGFDDIIVAPDVVLDLVKDAERYRWLRNGGSMPKDKWVEGALACFEDWLDPFYHNPELITGDDLDKKIDAAMAKELP